MMRPRKNDDFPGVAEGGKGQSEVILVSASFGAKEAASFGAPFIVGQSLGRVAYVVESAKKLHICRTSLTYHGAKF
jgi:hypothetical protein